jgi:hypothetical protein
MEASPEKEHIVEEIIITSIVEKESTTVPKEDNAMKNATPLMYLSCVRSSVGTELRNLAQGPGFESGRKFSDFFYFRHFLHS